jgi:hypothetical protein
VLILLKELRSDELGEDKPSWDSRQWQLASANPANQHSRLRISGGKTKLR